MGTRLIHLNSIRRKYSPISTKSQVRDFTESPKKQETLQKDWSSNDNIKPINNINPTLYHSLLDHLIRLFNKWLKSSRMTTLMHQYFLCFDFIFTLPSRLKHSLSMLSGSLLNHLEIVYLHSLVSEHSLELEVLVLSLIQLMKTLKVLLDERLLVLK